MFYSTDDGTSRRFVLDSAPLLDPGLLPVLMRPMLDRIRRNLSTHVTLADREFDSFVSLVQHRQLERRDHLLNPGDVCNFEGFVAAGCLRVYNTDPEGLDHILYFAPEGWWVADTQSFLFESPAELGIDALEPSEMLLIDKASKERLCLENPKFERLFRIMTQNALAAMQDRVIAAMAPSAGERYLDFRRRYPTLERRVPQYEIASYLGISPEALSRIRRNLVDCPR